jgi:hypothetical protein
LKTELNATIGYIADEFEDYPRMMDVVKVPLFDLGGPIDGEQITQFWMTAKNMWSGMFRADNVVDVTDFNARGRGHDKSPTK